MIGFQMTKDELLISMLLNGWSWISPDLHGDFVKLQRGEFSYLIDPNTYDFNELMEVKVQHAYDKGLKKGAGVSS